MSNAKAYKSLSPPRQVALCRLMEGTLRAEPLLGLLRLLDAHGVDADALIREVECEPSLFDDPENTIEFSVAGRLLDRVATVTSIPYPGLEFGRRLGLEVLGILGRAIKTAPDVGTALRSLILYFHLHDRGAIPSLWQSADRAMFGYTLYCPNLTGVDHIYDAALAISHNVLSGLVGREWTSTEVHMFRAPPEDVEPFRQHFRARLRFGTEHAAIVFPADHLTRPLPGADTIAYGKALRDLEDIEGASEPGLFENKIRRVLHRKLIGGEGPYGIEFHEVARLFELHPRTLNRRLRNEGTSFNALLSEARYRIAQQLLRDTHLPIGEIAFLLGYAESASFDHAFRRWSGTTATAWRSSGRPSEE